MVMNKELSPLVPIHPDDDSPFTPGTPLLNRVRVLTLRKGNLIGLEPASRQLYPTLYNTRTLGYSGERLTPRG